MSTEPVSVSSVASVMRRDAVLRELRRAVLSGVFAPGERLKEVQLAEQLGVSRPTLREGLYQLIHEGLLVQEPYKGIAVATIDAKSIIDVAEVRLALETIGALAIAADATGTSQRALRSAWESYNRAVAVDDPSVQHEAHMELHRVLWNASSNSMLQRIWPIVNATISLAISTDQTTRADPVRAQHVHRGLVEAVLDNRPDDIRRELADHTRRSAEELIEILNRRDRNPS